MNTLSDQPDEILRTIFGFVSGLDIIRVSQVNHKLESIIKEMHDSLVHPSIEQCIIESDYYHFKKYLGTKLNDNQKQLIKLLQNEILIRHFKIDIKVAINHLLMKYSETGHLEVVKLLVEKVCLTSSSEVNLYNPYNILAYNNALIKSARNGHIKVVKLLLEKGADLHVQNDFTFQVSAQNGHLDIVKLLLKKVCWTESQLSEKACLLGADPHTDNDLAFRWSAEYGHIEVVKLLLEHGADLHADNDYAFRLSAENGHLEVVKLLVEKGADIYALDNWAFKNSSGVVHEYLESILS